MFSDSSNRWLWVVSTPIPLLVAAIYATYPPDFKFEPESYPITTDNTGQRLTTPADLTPPFQDPGYAPEHPGVQILDMDGNGVPLRPEEERVIQERLAQRGLIGPGKVSAVIVVGNTNIVGDVDWACDQIMTEGKNKQRVLAALTPEARDATEKALSTVEFGRGRVDIIVTDKAVLNPKVI